MPITLEKVLTRAGLRAMFEPFHVSSSAGEFWFKPGLGHRTIADDFSRNLSPRTIAEGVFLDRVADKSFPLDVVTGWDDETFEQVMRTWSAHPRSGAGQVAHSLGELRTILARRVLEWFALKERHDLAAERMNSNFLGGDAFRSIAAFVEPTGPRLAAPASLVGIERSRPVVRHVSRRLRALRVATVALELGLAFYFTRAAVEVDAMTPYSTMCVALAVAFIGLLLQAAHFQVFSHRTDE